MVYLGCHFVDHLEVEGFSARGHKGDIESDEAGHFGGVKEVEALCEVGAPVFTRNCKCLISIGELKGVSSYQSCPIGMIPCWSTPSALTISMTSLTMALISNSLGSVGFELPP